MRVAGVIFQPSVGDKDVILERKPSNKAQNTLSSGPPPVVHKQVGFQMNIRYLTKSEIIAGILS